MNLRAAKKAKTRAAILKVARTLFLKKGFDHTLVRDIARRLQISEQTVFNYFPSKLDLVEGLAQDWYAENARAAAALARPLRPGASVMEAARHSMRQTLARFSNEREFVRLLLDHSSMARLKPLRAPQIKPGQDPQVDLARAQLRYSTEVNRAAQRQGEIRADVDPAELAETVFHLVGWCLRTWVDTEPPPALEELVFRRLRLLMVGVLPQPLPVRADGPPPQPPARAAIRSRRA